jgi:long-chain acyl-CoA synthetase
MLLRVRHRVYDRLTYAEFRASLGGRLRHVIAGGDPLSDRLGHFYRGSGVPVLESYGLTESTALLSVNAPDEHKVGTVGRPLPGTTVRVADDGELLAHGGQIFPGYGGSHQDARDSTKAVLADGWLHTGDIGEIDAEGYVRVSGRKAELLVTAGGKSVAPGVLEDLIRQHPLVGQCVVVGDGRPYVAALISLDPDTAAEWAERHGHEPDLEGLSQSAHLRTELQAAVDAANASVSHAESVRRFEVLPVALTEDAGYLTPTLKLRRAVVLADFRAETAALYDKR